MRDQYHFWTLANVKGSNVVGTDINTLRSSRYPYKLIVLFIYLPATDQNFVDALRASNIFATLDRPSMVCCTTSLELCQGALAPYIDQETLTQ